MFEDEGDDDEDKGSLFGIKHAANTNAATPAKVSALMIRFGGFLYLTFALMLRSSDL